MAYKVEFDFQQGMRSLGRLSRRAYDKVKDMTEEQANEAGRDDAEHDDAGHDRAGRDGADAAEKKRRDTSEG